MIVVGNDHVDLAIGRVQSTGQVQRIVAARARKKVYGVGIGVRGILTGTWYSTQYEFTAHLSALELVLPDRRIDVRAMAHPAMLMDGAGWSMHKSDPFIAWYPIELPAQSHIEVRGTFPWASNQWTQWSIVAKLAIAYDPSAVRVQ